LESNYNAYKRDIFSSQLYDAFVNEPDLVKKKPLAIELLEDFRKNV